MFHYALSLKASLYNDLQFFQLLFKLKWIALHYGSTWKCHNSYGAVGVFMADFSFSWLSLDISNCFSLKLIKAVSPSVHWVVVFFKAQLFMPGSGEQGRKA